VCGARHCAVGAVLRVATSRSTDNADVATREFARAYECVKKILAMHARAEYSGTLFAEYYFLIHADGER